MVVFVVVVVVVLWGVGGVSERGVGVLASLSAPGASRDSHNGGGQPTRMHVLDRDLKAVESPGLRQLHLLHEPRRQVFQHDAIRRGEKCQDVFHKPLLPRAEAVPVSAVLRQVDLLGGPKGRDGLLVEAPGVGALEREHGEAVGVVTEQGLAALALAQASVLLLLAQWKGCFSLLLLLLWLMLMLLLLVVLLALGDGAVAARGRGTAAREDDEGKDGGCGICSAAVQLLLAAVRERRRGLGLRGRLKTAAPRRRRLDRLGAVVLLLLRCCW